MPRRWPPRQLRQLDVVPGQRTKYFASTDGSYSTRTCLASAALHGYRNSIKPRQFAAATAWPPRWAWLEYLEGNRKLILPNVLIGYNDSYNMTEDATRAASSAGELESASGQASANTTWCSTLRTPVDHRRIVGHPLELDRVLRLTKPTMPAPVFATLDQTERQIQVRQRQCHDFRRQDAGQYAR